MASWAKYCINCAISSESIIEMEDNCPTCGSKAYYILTPDLVRSYKIGSIIDTGGIGRDVDLVDLAKWYRHHTQSIPAISPEDDH